jgi:hypothetical protein
VKYGIEAIRKMADEIGVPIEWAINRRKLFIETEISYLKRHQRTMVQQMSGSNVQDRDFIFDVLMRTQKEIHDYEREIYFIEHADRINKSEITDEMIDRAKEYPIEQLIEVKRNLALCINHSERKPSMNCKNNFAYCHSCGWSGDTISIKMKLTDCTFIEAVKSLQ